MREQVEKPKENISKAVANTIGQKKSDGERDFGFVDNRSEAVVQKKAQQLVSSSSKALQAKTLQRVIVDMKDSDKHSSIAGDLAIAMPLGKLKEAQYRRSKYGILMRELGIFRLKEAMEFKEKMELKDYGIDDLEIYLKGTRGLRDQSAMGNVTNSFANMQKWLRPTIIGRPRTLEKLDGKKMRFGKEPGHFLRVDDYHDGVLEYTIRTVNDNTRKTAGRKYGLIYENGRSLFAKAMAYYKDGVKTIKVKWVSTNPKLTDNLETYIKRREQGDSETTAALKTHSGKLATEFGFTIVNGPTEIENGVCFTFSKPEDN